MTQTEIQLLAVYRTPVVSVDSVAEPYFGLTAIEARRLAAAQRLGVPTFRLRDSRKAPLMVHVRDLAQYIDVLADSARVTHENCQV